MIEMESCVKWHSVNATVHKIRLKISFLRLKSIDFTIDIVFDLEPFFVGFIISVSFVSLFMTSFGFHFYDFRWYFTYACHFSLIFLGFYYNPLISILSNFHYR